MKVKLTEMYEIAREFLKENYDLELIVPIEPSPNMKTTFGYFRCNPRTKTPKIIKMSEEFMRTHSREVIIDVLKHELVHYALFMLEKPYCDKDAYFKAELDRLGIGRTRTYKTLGKFHRYVCYNCGKVYDRKKRVRAGAFCNCSGIKNADNLKYYGQIERES